MAFRSVLGKMGSIMTTLSSSTCIHKNGRLVLRIGSFEAINHNPNHSNNTKNELSMDDPRTAYLLEMGCYDENGVLIPMTVNRGIDYHMDLGGIGPACFAVEEFNKRKSLIDHLLLENPTAVCESAENLEMPTYHRYCYHTLILDAVDAAGVLNFYLASVEIDQDDLTEGMQLKEFNIFRDNGYPSRLYHHLDNFFVE